MFGSRVLSRIFGSRVLTMRSCSGVIVARLPLLVRPQAAPALGRSGFRRFLVILQSSDAARGSVVPVLLGSKFIFPSRCDSI